jgi:hypothetical protein
MANLTYRSIKGSPLTNDELDNNFSYFTGSFTNTGTITAIGFSGSFTGSLSGSITGTATNALTASYVTASNVIGMVSSASYALTSNPFPFIGNATFSGSVLVSGSIVPNVPAGSSTSSFSLGSPTAAWKDIYVSNGTINFLDGAGNIQGTLSSTANGISTGGDAYFNTIRIGQGPITGSANTILGETALNSATAGAANNTVIGNAALFANTTGLNNTIVGAGTALSNITGSRNTALGAAALLLHNSDDNTAIGWNSLLGITSGYRNTALGTAAGNNVSSTSFGNVYIGFNAGPTSSLVENNKLYINNTSSLTPLIGGDFSTGVATINSILQLQRRTTNPGSPVEGMIMASGSAGSSKLFYYNGTAWVDLTA